MAYTLNPEFYSALPQASEVVDCVVLQTASAESWTVPSGTRAALIACDGPIYFAIGATAAVPTTEVTNGTSSAFIPGNSSYFARFETGSVVSFIRAGASTVIITITRYL